MSDNAGIGPAAGLAAVGSATAWKLTLPCTRREAEAIDVEDTALDAVLMTTEELQDDAERWRLDAYVVTEPDAVTIAAVRALVPSADGVVVAIERLESADWVTMSQTGLAPLHVGRFYVHTGAPTGDAPGGTRAFRIDAGRAFGTGHHETTAGCLAMLDGMADLHFGTIIDVGTGTGLLAFAAKHLWPLATIVATDIDPIAIAVTRENAVVNHVDGLDLIVADGALDARICAHGPYDLVIANILAGPLVSMAPELASLAGPGGTLVLAGLLETQREGVVEAYAACGCTLDAIDRRGEWSVLRLRAGAERYVSSVAFDPRGRQGWALDL